MQAAPSINIGTRRHQSEINSNGLLEHRGTPINTDEHRWEKIRRWLISGVFHCLIVLMAYLCTIAINIDTEDKEGLITVVSIGRERNQEKVEPKKQIEKPIDVLNNNGLRETTATDKNAKDESDIEV